MKTQGLWKMEKRVISGLAWQPQAVIWAITVFGYFIPQRFPNSQHCCFVHKPAVRESSPTTFIITLLYSTIFSGGPSWFDVFFHFSRMTVWCCADCTAPLISFSSFTVGETAFSFPLILHSCLKSKMTNWQDSICCFSTYVFSWVAVQITH